MCCSGLHFFPICLVAVTLSTFCLTYVVSVKRNDVAAFFPYISDTGTLPPESCLFSFFLNFSAILSYCTMYIRFRQIRLLDGSERSLRVYNILSFGTGILSTVGLSTVASFQEKAVRPVHMTGAAFTIGFGIIYIFLQTAISYKTEPEVRDLCMCRLRLTMGIACTIFAALFLIGTLVADDQTHSKDTLHWKKEDGGFAPHIMSTICEWLTCIIFILFFATYVQEFKRTSADISFHRGSRDEEAGIRV